MVANSFLLLATFGQSFGRREERRIQKVFPLTARYMLVAVQYESSEEPWKDLDTSDEISCQVAPKKDSNKSFQGSLMLRMRSSNR